jgi:hypothetical protein
MNITLHWHPLLPAWLISLLALALLALLVLGSWLLRRKSAPVNWVWLLAALRVGIVGVFILALLRPVVSLPRKTALRPDVLVLADVSQSMAQPAADGSGTRLDEVRRALSASPAVRSAERTRTMHWFAFDDRARPVDREELDLLTADGPATDLAESLRTAFEHVRLLNAAAGENGIPARVLLASDGQDQGAEDVAAVARQLGLAVDVLPPRTVAGQAPPAVTLVDVQSAARVLLGSETALQVTLRSESNTDGCELVIEEDGREIDRRVVGRLTPGQETRVIVHHRPADAGPKRYVARLLRAGVELDRPRAVNVRVADDRHDVLLLEDTWRWEFKYLRRLLEDDPSFSCTAMLSRGGAAFVQFGEPDRRVELGGFPRGRGELEGFDTLIVGNVDPHAWPRGLSRHIHNAVVEGGKSLVVIAGPRLGAWTEQADLASLLPVELTAESGTPLSGPIELRITPEGHASGWFALAPPPSDGGAGREAFRPPSMDQVYPVLRKQPAATVLLEAVDRDNNYGPLIVMAEHTVGRGRVLFIAADTVWRWQTLGPRNQDGATLYTAFWQHALRALAPTEPATTAARLWLRPERTAYRAGERVRLTAQLESDQPQPADATATVVLPSGRRLPLDLAPEAENPRQWTAAFHVVEPGPYRIEATARGVDAQVSAEIATTIEVSPRAEEQHPRPVDAAALARLAAATGGRIIDPSAAEGWLPDPERGQAVVVRPQVFDLWHNFTLLGVLCLLLAGDWSLRLFRGYV